MPNIYFFPDIETMNDALGSWLGAEFEDLPEDGLFIIEVDWPYPIDTTEVPWEVTISEPVPTHHFRQLLSESGLPLRDGEFEQWLPKRKQLKLSL